MSLALQEAQAKNESLRATKEALLKPASDLAPMKSETQKKAEAKLKMIEMEKKIFELQQVIDRKELQAKHLLEECKEMGMKKKDMQTEVDKLRNAGKAVWETVGRETITYKDPFHTGLSKRTPTGGHFTS
eukprot:CAMPEP_0115858206 /NCGR_PEP_ID=MMETSP0287-20121206/15978_1 /TAXON_ID=412157 /ORGANISM="Chrysochromulina rotalis, Strain UIO044" /LENGTH=129 /DNA_ID=CAMNT_0003312463 /DNA_START=20 /DNA_END=409 /DNA_ORIENTATION=+